jgi:hypothetical protein
MPGPAAPGPRRHPLSGKSAELPDERSLCFSPRRARDLVSGGNQSWKRVSSYGAVTEAREVGGVVLRYGGFYGTDTGLFDGPFVEQVARAPSNPRRTCSTPSRSSRGEPCLERGWLSPMIFLVHSKLPQEPILQHSSYRI